MMTSFLTPQRWEFIKEKEEVKKKEITFSTRKATKKKRKKERKHALDQESKIQEKTITTKKRKREWNTQIRMNI